MQYLLLIYQSEAQAAQAGPAGQTQMSAEFRTLTQSIIQSGPFAETREQLAGYYLIDAKTLDDAIAIAARVPSARIGSIEIRPVRVYQ